MEKKKSNFLPRIIFGIMIIILIFAVIQDWNKVKSVLHEANWHLIPMALVLTLVSYLFSSTGYMVTNLIFGLPVRRLKLWLVGFINMTTNNLINLGGAAGYTVSAVLLKSPEVQLSNIFAASLFNTYLYFIFGTIFLPISLLYVILTHHLPSPARTGLIIVVGLAIAFAIIINLGVFSQRFRSGLLRFIARLVFAIVRRDTTPSMVKFDKTFTNGINLLKAQPNRLIGLLLLVTGDWVFCIAALWACFFVLGVRVSIGIAASGFFIGIAAGALSMIPGGLGVQEGSMAGVYALLGVTFERALLISILFRVIYYFIPFIIGLIIYNWILKVSPINKTQN